jgi:alpha-tubulin suppressor-like RCC1 family protein
VLYTCGLNNYNQLCLGENNTTNQNTLVKVPHHATFNNSNLVSATMTYYHSFCMIVDANGNVYGCGKMTSSYPLFEIGGVNSKTHLTKPTQLFTDNILLLGKVRQLKFTVSVACIVTTGNEVFVSGYYQYNGSGITNNNKYIKIEGLPDIKMCACTQRNIILLSTTGNLYSTGYANNGVLGNGKSTPNMLTYNQVPFDKSVKFLTTGTNSVAVITTENKLYCTGLNNYNHIGTTNLILNYTLLPSVTNGFQNQDIKMVALGATHILILNIHGQLYSKGITYSGQLGLGHLTSKIVPTLITTSQQITYISCGAYTSSFYKNGQLYTFGQNTSSALSIGNDTINIMVPTLVIGLPISI